MPAHYVETVASPAEHDSLPTHCTVTGHSRQWSWIFLLQPGGKRGLYVVRLGPGTGIWGSAGGFPSRNERRGKIAGRRTD